MDYTKLGRTGLRVSRLCLGTMNFGSYTSEADAFRLMDRALEAGINFFDTADVYGAKRGDGVTEQILGRWLALGGGRRSKLVLATKVYGKMGDWPNESGLSAVHIRRACDESLRRLGVDNIDLYQMHHIDRATPWEEVWQAMEGLVAQGKVTYIGSSNFAGWHLARAQECARERHLLGLVSEQSLYNLIDRRIESEVVPACQEYGLGLLPWSPLKAGVLAGPRGQSEGRRVTGSAQRALSKHTAALTAFEAFCVELGESRAGVALAWLLQNPVVTAPIIGPRTLEHLEDSLRALTIRLDATAIQRLDELFPGPGTAPEAYAW
jgi:aryl-alcohol dehydrogenase-like predicted oxidoreductase